MDQQAVKRRVRIAVSVFFGVLTVAMCVLWVRSYFWRERIVFGTYGDRAIQFSHVLGTLHFITFSEPGLKFWQPYDSPTGRGKLPIDEWRREPTLIKKDLPKSRLGFGGYFGKTGSTAYIPYWFLVVLSGTCAILPWLKFSWKFSLRTLLIATTLVAVALGLVCYFVR